MRKISTYTVEITITGYRDITGAEMGAGVLYFGDGNEKVLAVSDWTKSSLNSTTGISTLVMNHTYEAAGSYKIGYAENNRNPGVINIANGNSGDIPFYIETRIVLPAQANMAFSSANFLSSPIFRARLGEEFTHNVTAFNPEGALLRFQLIPSLQAEGLPVPAYEFPESISIDRNSGLITWTPERSGEFNFTVQVSQYVHGIFQGYTIRDFHVLVEAVEGNQEISLKEEEEWDYIGDMGLLIEPGDDLSFSVRYESTGGDHHASLEFLSELAEFPENYSFSTEESGQHVIGHFTFSPDAKLLRAAPYIITFRGYESALGENSFSKDISLLLYTKTPEEDIISSTPGEQEASLVVFPNPSSAGFIRINNANGAEYLQLFSIRGELLRSKALVKGNAPEVSLAHMAKGLYLYKVWKKGELLTSGKLLIE